MYKKERFLTELHRSSTGTDIDSVNGISSSKSALKKLLYLLQNKETLSEFAVRPPRSLLLFGNIYSDIDRLLFAFADELALKGYDCMYLDCTTLNTTDPEITSEYFLRVLNEAVSSAPCLIICKSFEAICPSEDGSVQRRLASDTLRSLIELFSIEEDILFMAVSNRPNLIDEAFTDIVSMKVRVPLPDRDARKAYILSELSPLTASEKTVEMITDSTANYNYGELDRLLTLIKTEHILCCDRVCQIHISTVQSVLSGFSIRDKSEEERRFKNLI